MNRTIIVRVACAALLFVVGIAAGIAAHAAEPIVPSAYVTELLAHAPAVKPDEKDAEMAAAGFSGMWMPVVLVYDRGGALVQAYNGPLDAFLAEPLGVGKLDAPIVEGLTSLLQRIGDEHAPAFALNAGEDYLIVLLSPQAMKSACASCKFAQAEVVKALEKHAIGAKVIDVDLTMQ